MTADETPAVRRFAIGETLATGCALLFRNFLKFAAIVVALGAPLAAVILGGVLTFPIDGVNRTGLTIASVPDVDFGALMIWTGLALVFVAGYAMILGAITHGAMQILGGAPLGIGAAIGTAFRRLPKLFLALLIYFVVLASLLGLLGWAGVHAVLTVVGRMEMSELGLPFPTGRFALDTGLALGSLILALLFLVLSWVFIPAVMVERAGPIACFRRSIALTRGRRWAALALIVLAFLANVGQSFAAEMILRADLVILGNVFDYGASGLLSALGATVTAVAYHRLRAEKEGGTSAEVARVFD
jgi:hypothetical protein